MKKDFLHYEQQYLALHPEASPPSKTRKALAPDFRIERARLRQVPCTYDHTRIKHPHSALRPGGHPLDRRQIVLSDTVTKRIALGACPDLIL